MPAGISIGKKVALAVFAGLLLLVVLQLGTYVLFAEARMPLAGLPRECVNADTEFVCVGIETWRSLTPAQRVVLERALLRRVPEVYHTIMDVPVSKTASSPITRKFLAGYQTCVKRGDSPASLEEWRSQIEAGRRVKYLRNGVKIAWHLDSRGICWMRCSSAELRGNGGHGVGRTELCVWFFGLWIKIYNCGGWRS
jgi:hypothetical protein